MAAAAGTGSTLQNVTDNQKRWLVFGISLNRVLVTQIRSFVEQEVQKEYGRLQTSHNIHTQSTSGRLKKLPTFLKYENINGNDAYPRLPGGRLDYSKFDCRVTSHVDFAKLYLENHMAKFNAFDEHCDASAVLALLGKVPVFSHAVQSAAGDVRQARNAWAHCVFSDWDPLNFQQSFAEMEQLVKALALPKAVETDLLKELKDWEMKGAILCMNATIDPDLVKMVQQDVNALKNDLDKLTFEEDVNRENVKKALQDAVTDLEELQKRVAMVELEQEVIKHDQSTLCEKMKTTQGQINELKSEQQDVQQYVHDLGKHMDTQVSTVLNEQEVIKQDHNSLCDKVNTTQNQMSAIQSEQEDVQRRVTYLEDRQNPKPQISYEISNCEAEITFFAERHDTDTRQWLLADFDKWFSDPGDSRAYVLLGDPGVGKSVMAGVLAQRSKKAGHLGAAYFCRHNDSTRNDPRCLLGTVACQLCECNSEYSSIMGGEDGVRKLLGNPYLGVQELFTKLLQEPLGKCNPNKQRKLVIIDALDETQYESREDFLDLIMNRFPLLPKWLVFFITSRPENTVQCRLKKYNPCVRICAGNVDHHNFYQQHDQDIKLFLRNKVDFSCLPFSVEDMANKCKGSFLYAFYIAKDLNVTMQSGKSFQLVDLFPGDFDSYLLKNFKRVFDIVGSSLFKKMFGCAIAAPAPLPVSFISYVLWKENSSIDKKHVVDALSLFMVLTKTFTFLHNLIPAWLNDEDKAEELFINKNVEANYLKDIIIEILFGFIHEKWKDVALIKADLLDYVLRFGIRFLCGLPGKDPDCLETVFTCLTSFKYIQTRIQSRRIEIYSLIEDLKLAVDCLAHVNGKKEILLGVCSALESNIFVLLECPYLLHSCLQNASKGVQKNIVIPENVSATCLQRNSAAWPTGCHDKRCYAVSPDGKLLAEGNRKSIFLYDSFSMERVLGPVDLSLQSYINHLEFSPEGKFLFYGRLDEWFSLEEKCVKEFPQFSGTNDSYDWGSFSRDQQCIVVKRSFYFGSAKTCCKFCLLNFLCLWATAEIGQGQESETICGCFPHRLSVENLHSEAAAHYSPVPAMRPLLNVLKRMQHDEWCCLLEKLKLNYNPFQRNTRKCDYCASRMKPGTPTFSAVRDFIINHYSMIFKYQVWEVKTGKSVLERAFSSDARMSPLYFVCHVGAALEVCGELFSDVDKAPSLCNIALLNIVCHHRIRQLKQHEEAKRLEQHIKQRKRYGRLEINAPLELQTLPDVKEKGVFTNLFPYVSPDGKWVAVHVSFDEKTVHLYPGENQRQHNFDRRNAVHAIKEVEHFAFTKDSEFFLYLTKQKSLHALSLRAGTILTSVSGVRLLSFIPEAQSGYIFRGDDEDNIFFLKDFPSGFLRYCFKPVVKKPMQATFASADTILVLSSDSVLTVMKTKDDGRALTTVSITLLKSLDGKSQQVTKFLFSQDGKLIVTHQGTKILLYGSGPGSTDYGKCVASVYETEDEFKVVHFTFSADSTLLLFCILWGNNGPYFFEWHVQKKMMAASFESPRLMSEDCCCCFSSDNKELIICTAFYIEIWDHAARPWRLLRKVETEVPCTEVDKLTHCIVSQDSGLLACCIVDRIHLYQLNTTSDQSILQLPPAHLGKIEFCQFLKGNSYLISYGVDGVVFLWDLSERKAIAFVKIVQGRESIVSMAVSPEEDKVICLTSYCRFHVIKLCGLTCAMLSKLPFPNVMSSSKMTETFRGQVEPTITIQSPSCSANTDIPMDFDASELIEEMDFMLSSDDNEDSDELDELQD